jgi:hypothetical protein
MWVGMLHRGLFKRVEAHGLCTLVGTRGLVNVGGHAQHPTLHTPLLPLHSCMNEIQYTPPTRLPWHGQGGDGSGGREGRGVNGTPPPCLTKHGLNIECE